MKAVKKNNKHHESPRFGNIHHTSIESIYHCWQYYKYCLEYTVSFDLMTFHSNSAEASNTPIFLPGLWCPLVPETAPSSSNIQISQLEKLSQNGKYWIYHPSPRLPVTTRMTTWGNSELNFDLPLLKLFNHQTGMGPKSWMVTLWSWTSWR